MDINYSCIDQVVDIFPKDMFVFVVERNFQKYYMRLSDYSIKYEIMVEKALKIDGYVLNLLEHKTVRYRFVGIYRFEENYGNLDSFIMTTFPTTYTRYSIMYNLTTMVSQILEHRDPKNPYFNINLDPSNLIMVSGQLNSMKLVKVFPTSNREIIKMSVPEKEFKTKYIDKRAMHVYLLGKLFYFICFRTFPTYTDSNLLNFLSDFNPKDLESESDDVESKNSIEIDPKIIYMIRRMLNSSPVDRPSFTEVLDIIKDTQNNSSFFMDVIHEKLYKLFRKMKSEVEVEGFQNSMKESGVDFAEKSMLSVDSIRTNAINESKIINDIKEKKLLIFLNTPLKNEHNLMDKFGMIKDVTFEDFMDDELRESLNQKRLEKLGMGADDVRDNLQEITEHNKVNETEDQFQKGNQNNKNLDKEIKKEFKLIMKKQIMEENKEIILENIKDHSLVEDNQFPVEYVLLIMVTLIMLGVFVTSLFFRNSKHKKWSKSQFHTALVL
jgi:hypothetical protein